MERLILIDANSLLHRAYHALPPLTTSKGEQVGAVFGFTSMLLKVFKELEPTYVAVAWDTAAPTFRHQEYTAYKEHRPEMPEDLLTQEGRVKKSLEVFNIPQFEVDGYEADDVIGTLARQAVETDGRESKVEGGDEIRELRKEITEVSKESGSRISIFKTPSEGKARSDRSSFHKVQPSKLEVIIVTGDLDALQLVNEQIKTYTPRRGFSDTVLYDVGEVKRRYGLGPEQLVDYKSLRGDPSDNIPGVRGIGEKTATQLLQRFGTLEEVYLNLDKVAVRQRKFLSEGQEEALLSQKLAGIKTDVPLTLNFSKCKLHDFDRNAVIKLFQELEFRSLVDKLPKSDQTQLSPKDRSGQRSAKEKPRPFSTPSFEFAKNRTGTLFFRENSSYCLVDSNAKLQDLIDKMKKMTIIALDVETDRVDVRGAHLVGISIATQPGMAWFVPWKSEVGGSEVGGGEWKVGRVIDDKTYKEFQCSIFESATSKKIIAHNIKYDAQVLARHGFKLDFKDSFDTMVAAHLLYGGRERVGLKELAFNHFGMVIPSLEELGTEYRAIRGGVFDWSKIPLQKVVFYACSDVDATFSLYEELSRELKQREDLEKLFYQVEMPLTRVLIKMETKGLLVDKELVSTLSDQMQEMIDKKGSEIFSALGHEFNVNSSQQLGEVLFDELKLPVIKKTKTQRSTDESVLRKLKNAHPVIEPLIKYRELFKLKSTYLDPLPELLDEESRVHTIFNQTRTTSGRLSSEKPNLQNVPRDYGLGLRKIFIAPSGFKLLVADYSQIELRIMAHYSQDKHLLDSFANNQDIHAATAARIFDCFIDEVTDEQRQVGKTMNFAVMYGMTAHGLAEQLEIEHVKAQSYIDDYFESYPRMKIWIADLIEEARESGFVETLMGRRRYLPDLSSRNYVRRAAAERMAVNHPIQGTAADLIKLAMVKIWDRLHSTPDKATLVLQVHDELVFEVPEGALERIGRLVKNAMEGTLRLRVPLKVDLKGGRNWGELETLENERIS